ncbi:hypothetical protein NL676_009768 [Syzygium grande]|nr:hypothetical protein NL676_009768 [Syzygium grande]
MSKVVYEGWMVRFGRTKIYRSYMHMRYFVLEPRLLVYYEKKPRDNQAPIKAMVMDGNCRVEDRGLKNRHGHMVYELCVYNMKEKHDVTVSARPASDDSAINRRTHHHGVTLKNP